MILAIKHLLLSTNTNGWRNTELLHIVSIEILLKRFRLHRFKFYPTQSLADRRNEIQSISIFS